MTNQVVIESNQAIDGDVSKVTTNDGFIELSIAELSVIGGGQASVFY